MLWKLSNVSCILTYFLEKFLMRFFNSNIAEGHISYFHGLLNHFSHFFLFLVSVALHFQDFLHGTKLTKLHNSHSEMLHYHVVLKYCTKVFLCIFQSTGSLKFCICNRSSLRSGNIYQYVTTTLGEVTLGLFSKGFICYPN